MKRNWIARVAFGTGIAVVAAMLCVSARPDEKSAATYKQKCASCHGADGKAESPAGKAMKVPSFASPETKAKSDKELGDIIANGKGKMPKYGASIPADDIKAMVAYVRELGK
jgi:mono/diheme cytochrome c family protein